MLRRVGRTSVFLRSVFEFGGGGGKTLAMMLVWGPWPEDTCCGWGAPAIIPRTLTEGALQYISPENLAFSNCVPFNPMTNPTAYVYRYLALWQTWCAFPRWSRSVTIFFCVKQSLQWLGTS